MAKLELLGAVSGIWGHEDDDSTVGTVNASLPHRCDGKRKLPVQEQFDSKQQGL